MHGRGVRVRPAAHRVSVFVPRGQRGGEGGVHVGGWGAVGRGGGGGGAGGGERGEEAELAAPLAAPQLAHLLAARAHKVLVFRYPHLLAVDYAGPLWSGTVSGRRDYGIVLKKIQL